MSRVCSQTEVGYCRYDHCTNVDSTKWHNWLFLYCMVQLFDSSKNSSDSLENDSSSVTDNMTIGDLDVSTVSSPIWTSITTLYRPLSRDEMLVIVNPTPDPFETFSRPRNFFANGDPDKSKQPSSSALEEASSVSFKYQTFLVIGKTQLPGNTTTMSKVTSSYWHKSWRDWLSARTTSENPIRIEVLSRSWMTLVVVIQIGVRVWGYVRHSTQYFWALNGRMLSHISRLTFCSQQNFIHLFIYFDDEQIIITTMENGIIERAQTTGPRRSWALILDLITIVC